MKQIYIFFLLLIVFRCDTLLSNVLKIESACDSDFKITLISGIDTLYNALRSGKKIIVNYHPKADELVILTLNESRYVIIPEKQTNININCKGNDFHVKFCNADDIFFNNIMKKRTEVSKNRFELAYRLIYDTTLSASRKDSMNNLLEYLRQNMDSLESTSMLANAPSKASLYFLHYNFSDKYYSKEYFVKLYEKIRTSRKIYKAHPTIINEIRKKLSLPAYTINDTITTLDANSIFLTDKCKYQLCVIVGQCHATQPNLLALEAKQAELQSKGIKVSLIATYADDEIKAICQKNNWQHHISEQFRETDFAYKLWNNSSFIAIYFEDRKMISITNSVADVRW